MSHSDVETILKQVELLLDQAAPLSSQVEQAVEMLLNVVEALSTDKKKLVEEVERLRQQLEKKKKAKTTPNTDSSEASATENSAREADYSSEKRRKRRRPSRRGRDRRSSKELTIHEEIECPLDPATLPDDAIQVEDDFVVVQDIKIEPHNVRFRRSVYYSPRLRKYFRGPLPKGYDLGDFSANLRALIVSLKYSANMSEPKIREFLENFDVQVSAGSVSNILTNTASDFREEFDALVREGLRSTSYQQTDDTSARVAGQFWHTHILCNPYYAAYFTRPHKDRLTVLEVLQNTSDLQFRLGQETLELLRGEFSIPDKWQRKIEAIGEEQFDRGELKDLLDGWFGKGNLQVRTAIEHASAIVSYRRQTFVPVIETIVCDDAGQFKLLTDRLALCWIHMGRHYEKLSPVAPRHAAALEAFLERYWDYYHRLEDYRKTPRPSQAAKLRLEFDELFSTHTDYEALDQRIATTVSKKEELLTVLLDPTVPLHNNASELHARVSARRRDVSLHSRSVRGADAMDIFTTLVQTSKKLGVNAYQYIRDRIAGVNSLPSLANCIADASAAKSIAPAQ